MKPYIIVLIVLGALLLIYLLLSFGVYWVIFHSPTKDQKRSGDYPTSPSFSGAYDTVRPLIEELRATPCEDVYIKSFDHLKLRGRYYHNSDSSPFAICVHGYRGTPIRDFCGGFKILKKMGFNILLIDQRAHLKSKGHTITFGIKESRDVASWSDYLVDRFGKDIKIILVGISMGAYCVVHAATSHKLPDAVKGVIADCPFCSPKRILQYSCKEKLHIPLWVGYPLLFIGGLLFGHFNLNNKKHDELHRGINYPLLIIHGTRDEIVPTTQSSDLAIGKYSSVNMRRYLFTQAGHGMSYITNPARYELFCSVFIKKCLDIEIK